MSAQRFSRAALAPMPWKNGGGTTQEIVSWPPGAGLDSFGWRCSIATIAAAGPFSVFAGIDRCIMLLDGDGVRLFTHDGAIDHALDVPHRPFAFSGEAAIDCEMFGGPSSDFNVMTRRGQWRAQVRVLDAASAIEAAPHGVLLAVHGAWRVDDWPMQEGEGVHWADAAHAWQAQPLSADARLLAVRIVAA
ncbi:HutD/Ves family protein [Xylophilus sp. ASV27]|uniref:HutD/Ves family protein n=1 Tax=Xylophilus sp. ASV27 TaxID=2795129 RepID=UPI0018EB07EB|nr:HutD family protein [Xylophilus sp. ASV27]